MDAKDRLFVFSLLLLSLGLLGSLSVTYCVWNKQTEMASELQNELHSNFQSGLQNKLLNMFQVELNSSVHLGTSEPSKDKGQLKRDVRQADEDTDTTSATEMLINALTEIIERKIMNCDKNEYNHTECTLKPGPKGEPGPEGPTGEKGTKGEQGDMGHRGEPGNKGIKGDHGFPGYPGYPGYKGEKGVVGPQGPPGPTGPQGPRGMYGKDGLKGEQGPVGPKGDIGLRGPTGERGDKGDMGERGLKGDMGPTGPQGETGERGGMGQKGEPGEKGMKGNEGDRGEQSPLALTTAPTTPTTTSPTPGQCGGPGWRRVIFLNMTNTSHVCPAGLRLTNYSKRTCGRANSGGGACSSTSFRVGGSQYSRVCGRALAYRFGYNFAFYEYNGHGRGIDLSYVDGLSLTHGFPGSRQHIWTFASGWFTGDPSSIHPKHRCPCDHANTYPSPPFVGSDYFCESVQNEITSHGNLRLYSSAPLWDGQVCESGGVCCHLNNPPWFTKNLGNHTTERIELRLCLHSEASHGNIALELLELYVQ